jgi:tripartite-type tricarboxylate transporter receptor subunit TctC
MRSLSASLCIFAFVFGCICGVHHAQAQSWPNRTITFIVPFPPGGSTSIVARVVADKMSQLLGQSIVVDNRGGAGGTVGTKRRPRPSRTATPFWSDTPAPSPSVRPFTRMSAMTRARILCRSG